MRQLVVFLGASVGRVEDKILPCFGEAVVWNRSLILKQKEIFCIAERGASSQTRAVVFAGYCVGRHGEHWNSCSGAAEEILYLKILMGSSVRCMSWRQTSLRRFAPWRTTGHLCVCKGCGEWSSGHSSLLCGLELIQSGDGEKVSKSIPGYKLEPMFTKVLVDRAELLLLQPLRPSCTWLQSCHLHQQISHPKPVYSEAGPASVMLKCLEIFCCCFAIYYLESKIWWKTDRKNSTSCTVCFLRNLGGY